MRDKHPPARYIPVHVPYKFNSETVIHFYREEVMIGTYLIVWTEQLGHDARAHRGTESVTYGRYHKTRN